MDFYELEDKELEDLLIANKSRIHVILSNTALKNKKWDERNKAARKRLIDAGVDIQHRMFNNSTHIGHNKFVVHVPPDGGKRSVFTGSTNWTSTGVAGQTNNALLIEDDDIANSYLKYWNRMKQDALKVPKPFSKAMGDNQQGAKFRKDNETPEEMDDGMARPCVSGFLPTCLSEKSRRQRKRKLRRRPTSRMCMA